MGGIIKGVKSIFSGSDSPDYSGVANANVEAARIAAEATKESIALQREMFNESVRLLEPWRNEGVRAARDIRDRMAQGESGFGAMYAAYNVDRNFKINPRTDPGYKFRLDQGQRVVAQQANARGFNQLGGSAQKALLQHGQNLASNEWGNAWQRAYAEDQTRYGRQMHQREASIRDWNIRNTLKQQYFSNLFSVNQLGYGAAGGTAQAGQHFGNVAADLTMQQAATQGQAGIAAANAGVMGQLGRINAQQQDFDNLMSLGRLGIGIAGV